MPSHQQLTEAATQLTSRQSSWLSRTLGWLLRKNAPDTKYVPENHPPKPTPPPTPLSTNRRNRKDIMHPARTPNVSGMFYCLVSTGMDPYEARELLLLIVQAREDPITRTSAERRAEKVRNRRVRFLDEAYGIDELCEVETSAAPPVLDLGVGFGEERFGEEFGEEFGEFDDGGRVVDEDQALVGNSSQGPSSGSGHIRDGPLPIYGRPSLGLPRTRIRILLVS